MKRIGSSYEFNDDELAAWVTWFLSAESGNENMEKEIADSLQECLGAFFASAKAFETHLAAVARKKGISCPKCHGRGHNNLYMAGSNKPGVCTNCGGMGKIEPSPVGFKSEDIDPMERG